MKHSLPIKTRQKKIVANSPLAAIIILLLMLVNNALWAQQIEGLIRGKVIDKDSRQPIVGAVVAVGTATGTATDGEGNFVLAHIKAGRVNLKISSIGYEEAQLNQVLVTTGKETVLQVELQEKVQQLREINVVAGKDKTRPNNTFATVSARSFSVEETKRYAGTLNDPSRMVQSFAGVVSSNDENNAIVVRGNSPRGLLWRMEGIEIPNPNHFAGSEGSTGGGVSILSANMLANTDFYSGAFPAEYGNAISGVFDLNLRKGNAEKWEQTIQVGILGLEAAVEGPFSRKYKGSYLVNYRYSTLDILNLMGFKIGGNQVPKYQDVSFNFYFPTRRIGQFTVFGLGGLSSLGAKVAHDSSKWKTFDDKVEESLKQKTGAIGITHSYLFRDHKTQWRTVVSLSGTSNGYHADTISDAYHLSNIAQSQFNYVNVRAHSYVNRKVDTRNTVRAGLIYQHLFYHLFNDQYNFQQQRTERLVNSAGKTFLVEGYWQWKHRFSDQLQVISGIHFTYGGINSKFYMEPRLSGEWRFKSSMALTAGVGLHSRMDPISTYTAQLDPALTPNVQQNRELDFTRSFHAVLGYQFTFLKDFRLKTEVYYQYLFAVPAGSGSNGYFSVINLNEGFVNQPLNNSGRGYNYGLEVTVEKFFTHNYYFLYTLSLFNSKYKGGDGIWRSTVFNSNYVMNALGGKEFVVGKRKVNRIGVNAKILWRGGMHDTPIDLERSRQAGETVYDHSRENSIKLPDYFRIDFGLNFRRNRKKWSWVLAADVQNLINRQNVARRVYNRNTGAVEDKRNIGIIPVFSYRVEF
ncbi:MAG: carboxypeptidase-like regulatory domain-containing protein [Chitinophagales bacterium]